MIQKYAVRKKLSGCFCIDGIADWVRSRVGMMTQDFPAPVASVISKMGENGECHLGKISNFPLV